MFGPRNYAHAFWHTYFLYGFPLDKPTYRHAYIYHAKYQLNSPVWGSLRSPNQNTAETYRTISSAFLLTLKVYGVMIYKLSSDIFIIFARLCFANRLLLVYFLRFFLGIEDDVAI